MTQFILVLGSIIFGRFLEDFSNVSKIKIKIREKGIKNFENWKILDFGVIKN